MKLEQACRFRTESGYRVCAKSAGFTSEQETQLGNVFNDSMNPLFAKMGQQILTCAIGRTDVLIAQSTMRSDIKARRSIFTNAYVIPADDYDRMMRENPGLLLSIPADRMLGFQPSGSELETVDLDCSQMDAFDLDALREKYALDDLRYAELLRGAYRAITSNTTVCLRSESSQDETLVREFVYCITVGLLPMLRGKLSYSSALDTRMNLCVATGSQSLRMPVLYFAVNPALQIDQIQVDDLANAFFQHLSSCKPAARSEVLDEMQTWLCELTDIGEGVSFGLIVAAFYLSGMQSFRGEGAARLLHTMLSTSKMNHVNQAVLDTVLVQLLDKLYQERFCPGNLLTMLVERALKQDDFDYDRAVQTLLTLASVPECTGLVKVVIQLPYTEKGGNLVSSLLKHIPYDCNEIRELANDLIQWMLSENVESLVGYCSDMLTLCDAQRQKELLASILEQAEGRRLKKYENILMNNLLGELMDQRRSTDVCLDAQVCEKLDLHFLDYSVELLDSCLSYFFLVRLYYCRTMQNKVALLSQMEKQHSAFFAEIKRKLANGTDGHPGLWENYKTIICLKDNFDYDELAETCLQYNQTQIAEGVFEQRVVYLWERRLKQELNETYDVPNLVKETEKNLEILKIVSLSTESVERIYQYEVTLFWSLIDYSSLIQNSALIPLALCHKYELDSDKKIRVLECCEKMRINAQDASSFCQLIQRDPAYYDVELNALKAELFSFAKQILRETSVLSLDLLLLHCYETDEDGAAFYHCKKLVALIAQMESVGLLTQTISIADSCLLAADETLRRDICKVCGRKSPRLLQELCEKLKPDRGRAAHERHTARQGSALGNAVSNLFRKKAENQTTFLFDDPSPSKGKETEEGENPPKKKKGGEHLR